MDSVRILLTDESSGPGRSSGGDDGDASVFTLPCAPARADTRSRTPKSP